MASMSFARAFSTKRNKPDLEITPSQYVGRASSQRAGRPIVRSLISSPVELISTSNVHVQTAQKIAGTSPIEIRNISGQSVAYSSSDESDASSRSTHSDETITDASSVEESPTSYEAKPNLLTSYSEQSPDESLDLERTPTIPQRSPSRSSKQAPLRLLSPSVQHEVARSSLDIIRGESSLQQSSTKGLQPAPVFQNSQDGVRSSFDIINQSRPRTAPMEPRRERTAPAPVVEAPQGSPFDAELAQLDQIAEEFGQTVRNAEDEPDVKHMQKRGLASFSASDYMSEIQSLVHNMFAEEQPFFRQLGGFF